MFIDGRRFFERPSIPQTGWMGKVPLSLFEGNLFAPSEAQSGLPRSYETIEDQTFCIQTQPVSAALFYVAVFSGSGGGGWWGPWFPGDWWGPWFPSSSFDPIVLPAFEQQLSSFNYETLDRFDLRDQPTAADLMYAPVFIGGGGGPGGGGWWGPWFPGDWWGPWFPSESPLFVPISDQTKSFKTDEELSDRFFVLQSPVDLGWIVLHLPTPFNPALISAINQLVNSYVSEQAFDHERLDQPINAGDWKQALDLWEVVFFAAINDQVKSKRSDDESIDREFILQTIQNLDWLFNVIPSLTAEQLQAAIDQLLNSYRVEKSHDELQTIDQPVQVGVWKPALNFWEFHLYPSISDQSQSTRFIEENVDKTIRTDFQTGWVFSAVPVAPAFDPALGSAIFSQTQMPEVRESTEEKSRHDQFSQGWVFYQVPVLSADTQHELLGAVATASITINLSLAIPVDLTALFGFVTANDKLVCTNLTIESLN